jgi:hypothetical protein
MGYRSACLPPCEYTVFGNRKNDKNRKNEPRKLTKSTKTAQNHPGIAKSGPVFTGKTSSPAVSRSRILTFQWYPHPPCSPLMPLAQIRRAKLAPCDWTRWLYPPCDWTRWLYPPCDWTRWLYLHLLLQLYPALLQRPADVTRQFLMLPRQSCGLDVMSTANSSPRGEAASPPLPWRGGSQKQLQDVPCSIARCPTETCWALKSSRPSKFGFKIARSFTVHGSGDQVMLVHFGA